MEASKIKRSHQKPVGKGRLDTIRNRFNQIQSIVVNLAVVSLIIILTHMIWREVNKSYIIFESIEIPEDLSKKGYSGVVFARRLIDEMNKIKAVSEDSVNYTLNPQSSNIPIIEISKKMPDLNFEIPETKISFSSIINFFRIYFDRKLLSIDGDIIIHDKYISLNCRYKDEVVSWERKNIDSLNSGIKYVALELLKTIRPITVANYYYAKNKLKEDRLFLINKLPSLNKADRSDAYLILALIENNVLARDTSKAANYFKLSIQENSLNASAYNNFGLFKTNQGYDVLAEKLFKKSIEVNPKSTNAYINLGLLKLRKKNRADTLIAEKFYLQAVKINPNQVYAYNTLANLKRDQGKFLDAEQFYLKAIEVNPKQMEAYVNLGLLKRNQRLLPEAESLYKQAIYINPKYAYTYIKLGAIKNEQGDFNAAENLYLQAIGIDSMQIEAYNNLGLLRRDQGRFKEAYNLFLKANQLAPKDHYVYSFLGLLKKDQGFINEAIVLFNKSIKINSTQSAFAYNNLGHINRDLGLIQAAKKLYLTAYNKNKKAANTYSFLGITMFGSKNINSSRWFYKKAIKVDSTASSAYAYLGLLEQEQGNLNKAASLYSKAIAFNQNYVDAYIYLSRLKSQQGNVVLSDSLYKKAMDISLIGTAYTFNNLGNIYRDRRNFSEAEKMYRQTIKINKNYIPAYINLALIAKRKNELLEVKKIYELILEIDPANKKIKNQLESVSRQLHPAIVLIKHERQ